MTYEYRDDQLAALDAIDHAKESGAKSALVSKATGLGKTVIGCEYITRWIDEFKKKSRILVLGHTELIFTEFRKHLDNMLGFNCYTWGEYSGNMKDLENVQVLFGTFQTLTKEEHIYQFKRSEFDLIVVDECHHAMAETYKRVVDYFEPKFTLALTATPDRMDRKEIREIFGEEVYSLTLPEAMSRGGLLAKVEYQIFVDNLKGLDEIKTETGKLKLKALNKKFFIPQRDEDIAAQIVNELSGTENPRVMVFCPSIDYAKHMASVICGEIPETTALVSSLSQKERELRLKKFRSGQLKVLCAVDMLNEVLDVPEVTHVVFLRTTQSYTILLQQLGRGLRLPKDNPAKVVKVLDFVCSFERIKMIAEIRDQIEFDPIDRDPFEVKVDHGSFDRLLRDVNEILRLANPFWSQEEVVEAWKRACDIKPRFKTEIYKTAWEKLKKSIAELHLPNFYVLKHHEETLKALGVIFVRVGRKNIPFSYLKDVWAKACEIEPKFKTEIYPSAWVKFKKSHPELNLPFFGTLVKYEEAFNALGVTFVLAMQRNIPFYQVKASWVKACQVEPKFKTEIYERAWTKLRILKPELNLPDYGVLKRREKSFKSLGVTFVVAHQVNIPFFQVKEAWEKACEAEPQFKSEIFAAAWQNFRRLNSGLDLPGFRLLKKHEEAFKALGVTFVVFDNEIPFSQLKDDWMRVCEIEPRFRTEIYGGAWKKLSNSNPALNLSNFRTLKKHEEAFKALGVTFLVFDNEFSFSQLKEAWIRACEIEPSFRTEIYCRSWTKLAKSNPKLLLPSFYTLKKHEKFFNAIGVTFVKKSPSGETVD